MVQTEIISVNESQKKRLRAAAQSRVVYWRKRGRKHTKLEAYFKPLPKKVARNFKTGCGYTPHSVVRVARGLRKQANIKHKSKLRIKRPACSRSRYALQHVYFLLHRHKIRVEVAA